MKAVLLFLLIFICRDISAQWDTVAVKYASTIDSQTIREYVFRLASSEFQGRETGTKGNEKAAQYIADQIQSFNLPTVKGDNDYFQEVAFTNLKWEDIQMTINGRPVEHLRDYLSIPYYFPVTDDVMKISSMTFLGYGVDDPAYSDYGGKNFEGQHLLVYAGEPRYPDGRSRITGTDSLSEWTTGQDIKIIAAQKVGAASIWIIDDKLRDAVMDARRYMLSGATTMGGIDKLSEYIPHARISPSLGEELVGNKRNKVISSRNTITEKGKPCSAEFPVDIEWKAIHNIKLTEGMNVIGYIEGVDPLLKNEFVVVTAHYDHLGMRGNDIFYGADDNASGTAAVLEIAQAMAMAKADGVGPKRSVVCMLVTGEEKGLLGSSYYSRFPVFPLEQTIANVNIDMIGRTDTLHKNANYTYVIGANRLSTELHEINETVNSLYTNLELDYTYNEDDDPNRFYYRSDHYNFAKEGVPAIFYFSGVHEDYHRPSDSPEKLMYGKAQTIARLAFHTAWELANRPTRIKVNVIGRT